MVNYIYNDDSLKSQARGLIGIKINNITGSTKLPRDWKAFPGIDNKTMLVEYLACEVVSVMKDDGKVIVFTTRDKVLAVPVRDNSRIQPCNHEEADSRMFLHVSDAANDGHTSFMIRTNDTDVSVLAIALASRKNHQIYVSFGTGEKNQYSRDSSKIRTSYITSIAAISLLHWV